MSRIMTEGGKMKKLIIIVLTLFLVPMLFGINSVPRIRNRIQEQVRTSTEDTETQVPYRPGNGHSILFVEDPGDTIPPSPDPLWQPVLDSILDVGNYGWFGPTTDGTQDGPMLEEMQNYNLVIWNTAGSAYQGPTLTATDQTNIQDYISGGGRFWLISQDAIYSGVPLSFFQTNFNVDNIVPDYNSGIINIQGLSEIAGNIFSVNTILYLPFPDALTPNANAHHIVMDVDFSLYPSILSNDSTTSFWTVDGRNPSSWSDWQKMVSDMLAVFGFYIFHDVGPVSIDIPSTVPEDTTFQPLATVKNLGTGVETFDVVCEIDPGVYSSTETVTDLASGDSIQVTFSPDFTFVSGSYTVTVYTELIGDDQSANDTLEKIIETYDPGIAEGGSVTPASFSFGLRSNPAKGKALFNLALPEASLVALTIYDVSGRVIDKVLSEMKSAGYYNIPWKTKVNGIYFYTFESSGHKENGKLVILR